MVLIVIKLTLCYIKGIPLTLISKKWSVIVSWKCFLVLMCDVWIISGYLSIKLCCLSFHITSHLVSYSTIYDPITTHPWNPIWLLFKWYELQPALNLLLTLYSNESYVSYGCLVLFALLFWWAGCQSQLPN